MSFLFEAHPGLAFFDVGGVRPLLDGAVEASAEKRSSIIYYQVADIQAACKTMRERGVTFEQEAHTRRQNARPRVMDGLFPRPGREPAGTHVRSEMTFSKPERPCL